jgi:hypothetical protein
MSDDNDAMCALHFKATSWNVCFIGYACGVVRRFTHFFPGTHTPIMCVNRLDSDHSYRALCCGEIVLCLPFFSLTTHLHARLAFEREIFVCVLVLLLRLLISLYFFIIDHHRHHH